MTDALRLVDEEGVNCCLWCDTPAAMNRHLDSLPAAPSLPSTFCWTKVQDEAGEPLSVIVARKELERRCGAGLFFWGIGSALGDRLNSFVQVEPDPKVLFSVMRSRPKRIDSSPKQVLAWTSYLDHSGAVRPLPPHTLLLSRGDTESGPKIRHYALVCSSNSPLRLSSVGSIALGHFRNLKSSSDTVGASQVTAIVEHQPSSNSGPSYQISMMADLAPPYFIRLANPVALTSRERTAIAEFSNHSPSIAEWDSFVQEVRRSAASRIQAAFRSDDFVWPDTVAPYCALLA